MAQVEGLTPEELEEQGAILEEAVAIALGVVAASAAAEILAVPVGVAPTVLAAPWVSLDDLAVMATQWLKLLDQDVMPIVRETVDDTADFVRQQIVEALPTLYGQPEDNELDVAVPSEVPPIPDVTADLIMQDARNRLVGIGDIVWANARQQLADGIREGDSIQELADRVRTAAAVSEPRARTIARTEVVGASNSAAIAQARSAGVPMRKLWMATEDARTRPSHALADGQTVELDEPFDVGGFLLDFPGDPTGPPQEIISCRCAIGFLLGAGGPVVAAGIRRYVRDDIGRFAEVPGGGTGGADLRRTLGRLKVKELQDRARASGLKGLSKAKKADLVEAIAAHDEAQAHGVPTPKVEAPKPVVRDVVAAVDKSPDVLAAEEHVKKLTANLPASIRKEVTDALNTQAQIRPRSVRSLEAIGFNVSGKNRDWGIEGAEYVRPKRMIDLNPKLKTQKAAIVREAKSSQGDGYLTPTGETPLGGYVAHEFGHHVAFGRYNPQDTGMPTPLADRLFGNLSAAIGVPAPTASRRGNLSWRDVEAWMSRNRAKLQRELSEYGAENIHEILAEGWQEYSTRGDRARPAAKAIGRALNPDGPTPAGTVATTAAKTPAAHDEANARGVPAAAKTPVRAVPKAAGIPSRGTLTPDEIKRAKDLIRRDPTIFATAQERFGRTVYAGNLSKADEDWLEAVIKREPGLTNYLAQQRQLARDQRDSAKKAGQSLPEYRRVTAARLKDWLSDKPIATRVTNEGALRDIVSSGRFKTSFEGSARGAGLFADLKTRRLGEEIHGIPADTPNAERPVYGYVAVNGVEPALSAGRKIEGIREREGQEDVLSAYGKIQVILKPDVRERTFVTVGDSLDEVAFKAPSPIDDPSADSISGGEFENRWGPFQDPDWTRRQYVEAQIRDGVRSEDIAEVVFADQPSAPTVAALEAAGIPWQVLKPGGEHVPVTASQSARRTTAPKPRAPRVSPLETAARRRQATIDKARARGDVLADVEAWLLTGADVSRVARTIDAAAETRGVDRDRSVAAVLRAVATGDRRKVRASLGRAWKALKLERIGPEDDTTVVRFDPAQHELIDGPNRRPAAGRGVELVKPGVATTVGGERVVLSKAIVEETDRAITTAGVQAWDCGCDNQITTAARRRTYVRDDQGRFDDVPGGGGSADKLKLGSRISLGPGETLMSSKKIRTDPDSWDLLAAQVDTPAGRELRLGIIWAEDVKNWAAGPDPKRQARLEAIDEEIERLEAMEEAEFSDADFERMEALEQERADLAGFDDEELNRTVVLNTQSVRQLRSELSAGVQHARAWSEQQNEFWDAHADLADEDFELNNLERSQGLTPEQQDRRRAIRQVLDAAGDPDVILAEGSVPGGVEGDLVYRIAGTDDGEGGWDLSLGIRDVDADWMLGGEDDKAVFEPKDVDRLLRELATLGGDGATTAAAVWSCGCPTTAGKDVIVRDGHSITVNRDGQGQFAEKAGGSVGRLVSASEALKAPTRKVSTLSRGDQIYVFRGRHGAQGTPLKGANAEAVTVVGWSADGGSLKVRLDFGGVVDLYGRGGGALRGSAAVHEAPDRYPGGPSVEQIQAMSDAELRQLAKSRGVNVKGAGRAYLLDKLDVPFAARPKKNAAPQAEASKPSSSGIQRQGTDLAKMKVPELRKLATARGLKGLSKATKPQLVEALKAAQVEGDVMTAGTWDVDFDAHLPGRHDQSTHGRRGGGLQGLSVRSAVGKLGSEFHENWRASRKQDDGTFEPRVKKTKDKAWIRRNGTDEVDIANTDYNNLPDDWQAENREAARVVMGLVREGPFDLDDPEDRDHVGSVIHDAWLERNSWAKGGDLDVPFADLPEDEQDKDLDQYRVAQKLNEARTAKTSKRKGPTIDRTRPTTAAAGARADVIAVLSALRSRLSGDVRDELDAIIADLQTLTAGYQVDLDAHLPGGHNQADHGRRRTGVLGSVLDRLGGLRSKLGGDDLAELDRAMDMLRNLESSDVDDDDLAEPEVDDDLEEPDVEEDDGPTVLFDSYSAGDVEMNHYTDGSISVHWGDGEGSFSFNTPQEARDVAALFEKVASAPGQPDSPMGTLVAEATTPDGKWKVARWDGDGPGSAYELGEPDDVTQDSEPYSTLSLEDTQTDEANDFARALRELAQLADEVLAARPTTAGSMFDADVSQMPAQLQAYWLTGEGAAKVKWCTEGSFRRARRLMLQEGVPARMVNGTVANLYRKACGKNPGRHTSLELAEQWHVVEGAAGCSGRFAVSNADGNIDGCFDTRVEAFTHIADLQGLQDTFGPPDRSSDLTAPAGALWHAVVHTEGISTGKRTWLPQSVEWRPPPFALHQEVSSSAHGGQPVTVYVGNTLAVARTGNAIHLWGDIDIDSQQGLEWARKLMAGYGGWPSFGPGSEAIEYDLIHGPVPGAEPQQVVFRKYRMGEVTAVSVPGQEGTYFEPLPALVDALGARTAPTEQSAPIVVAGGGTHTVEIPNLPPPDWFTEPPAFPHGYAVVMEDNGHIYGLVAPDGEAHRTYAQAGERRTLGSLGKIDLTRYMRETIVEGGQRVYAGPLTMECMHAPTQGYGRLDRRNQFYQDTCSVFARVAVGMCTDGAGMWLNGAAMPGVTSDQVLKFLACGVSLDVQPHPEKRGWLELVAVLVVPSEGWAKSKQGLVSPVTRIRETEDGGVLVASVVPTVFDGPPVSPRIDSSIVFGIAADAGINPETRIAADAAKVTKMLAGR